jgi:hypothetical protein
MVLFFTINNMIGNGCGESLHGMSCQTATYMIYASYNMIHIDKAVCKAEFLSSLVRRTANQLELGLPR